MIYLNEKIKKYLKAVGVFVGILFLWGVFNLFFGEKGTQLKRTAIAPTNNGMERMIDSDGWRNEISEKSMSLNDVSNVSTESVEENASPKDKKVIKNGVLSLKVESVDEAVKNINDIVEKNDGEIFSSNIYERIKGRKKGNITVKVPVDKFSEIMVELKQVASQVVSESTMGRDVTEQYVDLQAQLKNKQAEEQSFMKILDRAEKIDDVLAVTKQLSRVRGEIERLQGRIKYMEAQTDMATININLSEDIGNVSVSDNWRPSQTVKKSFKELVNNIQSFADGTIRFLIVGIPSLIPFLLFLIIVYWGIKRIYKKIKV